MAYDIEVNGLRKEFAEKGKKVVAVDDVSFAVKHGEIFGLLGVNGAGKTTTINMITGLLKKDAGEIRVLGLDPEKHWEETRNKINVSTAYFSLSEILTIRENLRVYGKIYGIKNVEQRIDELLERFELKELQHRKIAALSSGEKTRTALCKGLINKPKVLFLDECTVGLDPDIAEKTRQIIVDYRKEEDATILFTSHYMHEVEELCSRIAFMDKGKIITIATADELKRTIKKQVIEITVKEKARELKDFLSSEDVNVVFAEGNALIFEASYEKDKVYKVLNKIFTKGFLLSDLHIKKPTLDEVFIKFARRRK